MANIQARDVYVIKAYQTVSPSVLKIADFSVFHSNKSFSILAYGPSLARRLFAVQRKERRLLAYFKIKILFC